MSPHIQQPISKTNPQITLNMKAKNFNIVFQGMWIILCITLFSCGSTEKAAVSCPEFPASRFRVGIHQHNLIQARALNSNFKNRK